MLLGEKLVSNILFQYNWPSDPPEVGTNGLRSPDCARPWLGALKAILQGRPAFWGKKGSDTTCTSKYSYRCSPSHMESVPLRIKYNLPKVNLSPCRGWTQIWTLHYVQVAFKKNDFQLNQTWSKFLRRVMLFSFTRIATPV